MSERSSESTSQNLELWGAQRELERQKPEAVQWLEKLPPPGGRKRDSNGGFLPNHGLSNTREYTIWKLMLRRCYNQRCKEYPNYGGRGIRICVEWVDFRVFLRDMGTQPDKSLTLDRRNNLIGYCRSNCKWSTRAEQQNNTRRNRILVFNGRSLNIAQWASEVGISRLTIRSRLLSGWTVERALTEPTQKRTAWKIRD